MRSRIIPWGRLKGSKLKIPFPRFAVAGSAVWGSPALGGRRRAGEARSEDRIGLGVLRRSVPNLALSRIASSATIHAFTFLLFNQNEFRRSKEVHTELTQLQPKAPCLALGQVLQAKGVPQSPKQIPRGQRHPKVPAGTDRVCGRGRTGKV